LSGYYQPVEIKAPPGALISMAVDNQFEEAQPAPKKAGLLIGAVYRLRVTNIRLEEGVEVFPTIEVVDRVFAPEGQQRRFAIPIDISEEDLKLAADGKFVTRVIYLEDPRSALPVREDPKSQTWYEAKPGQDPLAVADGLGRPVAILRMGGRLPVQGEALDEGFFIGSPPFVAYPPEKAEAPIAPKASAPQEEAPKAIERQEKASKASAPQEEVPKAIERQETSAPQEKAPKANPFRDEIPKGNALREETPKGNTLREESPVENGLQEDAPKGNALRDEAPKAKTPEPEAPKEDAFQDEVPADNKPQEEAPKVNDAQEKAPVEDNIQEKAPKLNTLPSDVPKVNILPPPPEMSKEVAAKPMTLGKKSRTPNDRKSGK
jgi:hypothetical protein